MQSIRQEILAMLDSGPKSMSELYEGVRGKRSSIDKARQRLLKQGKIERVDHGVYQKSASLPVNIDFSELSEAEKTNHELNHIGNMIDQTCELVDKIYTTSGMNERLEILANLLQSTVGFVDRARGVYRALEEKATAELAEEYSDSDEVDLDSPEDFTPSEISLRELVNELLLYKEEDR